MSTETSTGSNSSEDIVQSIAHLTMGCTLLKAGRSGRPHYRRFQLSADLSKIFWESPRKGETGACVHIRDIKKLVRGQETAIFKATPVQGYEAFSFSLIYNSAGNQWDNTSRKTGTIHWNYLYKRLYQRFYFLSVWAKIMFTNRNFI